MTRVAALRHHAAAAVVGLVVGLGLIVLGLVGEVATLPVYVVVSLIGAVAVLEAARRGLSHATVWGLVAFGLGNLAGGTVPVGEGVLYGWWLVEPVVRYDNVQHAIGFGAVGRAGWELLRPRMGHAADDALLTVLTIVTVGVTAGAMNEIVEWVMVLTIPGVDIGGYDNTVRDLVANLVGATAWAILTLNRRPPRVEGHGCDAQPPLRMDIDQTLLSSP